MFAEAVRAWVKASTSIGAGGLTCWQRVSSYDAGAGGDGKGFFIQDPPPVGCLLNIVTPNLFVVTATETGGIPWDVRGNMGLQVNLTVIVRGPNGYSDVALCDMSYDMARILHHAELAVAGYENYGVYSSKPDDYEDDMGFPGYRIPLRTYWLKS